MKINKVRVCIFILFNILIVTPICQSFYVFGLVAKLVYYADNSSMVEIIMQKLSIAVSIINDLLAMTYKSLLLSISIFIVVFVIPLLLLCVLLFSRLFLKKKSFVIKEEVSLYRYILYIIVAVMTLINIVYANSSIMFVLIVLVFSLLYYFIWYNLFIKSISKICIVY